MRGIDDEQEALAIDREFKLLNPEERRQLYGNRKAHKEIVIFLHEWGHTAGPAAPRGSDQHHEPALRPAAEPLLRLRQAGSRWSWIGAWRSRSEAYPETADLCACSRRRPATKAATATAPSCWRSRGSGRVAVAVTWASRAAARGRQRRRPAARRHRRVQSRRRRAERPPPARRRGPCWLRHRTREQAKDGAKTWARLAGLASAMGALTAAEDAASRGGGGALVELGTIANDVAVLRQQVCLPRAADTFAVTPANEPAYIAGYWEARARAGVPGGARRPANACAASRSAFPTRPASSCWRAISSCAHGGCPRPANVAAPRWRSARSRGAPTT